jgi:hypothetical protein
LRHEWTTVKKSELRRTATMSLKRIVATIVLAATCLTALVLTRSARSAVFAADNASNAAYSDGWQAGDNGGTGFGPWIFSFSGSGSGLLYLPQFIDNGPLPGDSLGAPSFALTTGDQRSAFETSEVRRTFTAPLLVGEMLSADINGSALDSRAPAFTIGNTFDLLGTNGSERFSLFTNNEYHAGRWTATGDADTGIQPGSSFHVDFTLVSANTYNLVLSPVAGGAPLFAQMGAPLAGTTNVGIDRLRITDYGTGSSADGSKELFFDNLTVTGPNRLLGDYNNNGIVDATDYAVWRHTLGMSGADLAADGNTNNQVDEGDYAVWRSHFSQIVSTGASTSVNFAVPEPGNLALAFLGVIAALALGPHKWVCRSSFYR